MKNEFLFSVIIPVYNVENYLEETIKSVIGQTIGFKKNIEIILVNDGSTDNSEKICLKYESLFKNNIKYIKQKNKGVSNARNNGLKHASGKYINFLDSDDKWDKNVFKKVLTLYEKNDDLNIVGVRIKSFEASSNYSPLDYKFDKDKVIDINEEWDHIQLSSSSAFFRKEALKNLHFDERIKYSEDAKFILELLLDSSKLGLVSSSLYYYRNRRSGNSAIQTKNESEDWYINTPKLCYKYLFDLSKKKYGKVLPFIQYYVAYEYSSRTRAEIPNTISENVVEDYIKLSKELFKEIDIETITSLKNLPDYKLEMIKFKLGKDILNELEYKDMSIYYKDFLISKVRRPGLLKIPTMKVIDNNLLIKGLVNTIGDKETIFLVINNDERRKLDLKTTNAHAKYFFNKSFYTSKGFEEKIPLKNFKSLHFELETPDGKVIRLAFGGGIFSKLSSTKKTCYITKRHIFYYYKRKIKAVKNTMFNRLRFSARQNKLAIKKGRFDVLLYRFVYRIFKLFKHKQIWLFTDRLEAAKDNGFALFKYVIKQNNKNIKPYFVLLKNCEDYDIVKKYGKVLKYNSFKYKLYFLLADKIISSHADNFVYNAFGKDFSYYSNLYNFDFVFLQHGVIHNDLSFWLNSYEKDISLFITSSKKEQESIINGKYGFTKDVVKLLGLPRYDLLDNKSKKQIVIAPTWRHNLAGRFDYKTGLRAKNPKFKHSKYFEFYSKLINDKELLETMKKYGYKGIFALHPAHSRDVDDFSNNDVFDIIVNPVYSKLLSEAKLLVTDYSSVCFDFSYLRKPILYTQYDKDTFFKLQKTYVPGYFTHDKDGFGPVVTNYEDAVKEIIKFIKNDCALDKKYRKRIDEFFEFNDKNNCKRVYKAILDIDNNK